MAGRQTRAWRGQAGETLKTPQDPAFREAASQTRGPHHFSIARENHLSTVEERGWAGPPETLGTTAQRRIGPPGRIAGSGRSWVSKPVVTELGVSPLVPPTPSSFPVEASAVSLLS